MFAWLPFSGRVLSAKTSSLHVTVLGLRSTGGWTGLQLGGGGSRRVGWGGGSRWGDLGCCGGGGGRGAQAPLTSPCPPSNHTITINLTLTLTFASTWFGHASHVDWAEQDPPNFVHGCFCTSLLSILDPNTHLGLGSSILQEQESATSEDVELHGNLVFMEWMGQSSSFSVVHLVQDDVVHCAPSPSFGML